MKKTKFLTKQEAADQRKWLEIDANGKTLGRLASEVAVYLKGKHKPTYTPHNDCGDFVIVTNAANVKLTGKKATDKFYYRHSGYIGGLKKTSAGDMREDKPERLLEMAVKKMLPKTKLGNAIFTKLKVYAGSEHPHSAQNPTKTELKYN